MPSDPFRETEIAAIGPPDGDAESSEPRGEPFGRYRLISELGRGGMGIVWKAWDTRLKRIVALKQILADAWASPEACERFLREAQFTAQLHHPNIVAVHDVGEEEGRNFLTMDFVDGVALSKAAQGRVPAPRAMEWARQIAEALAYAHEKGVIHRDVKPANVLVDHAGKAYVVDFGLAREVDAAATEGRTASGALLGTPQYMSPEQARGDRSAVGPASDQFAVGVVLYELLTGRVPFQGHSLRDLLNVIAGKEPQPRRAFDRSVPLDAQTICLRAIEKPPGKRYASMSDLAADLGRAIAGEPILARPLSTVARLARQLRRRRAAVLAGALVVATALAFTSWRSVERARTRVRVHGLLDEAASFEARAARLSGAAAEGQRRAASGKYVEALALDPENAEASAGRTRADRAVAALAAARSGAERLLEDARPPSIARRA